MKCGKAVGLDGIPNEFYRFCVHRCRVLLSMICNSFLIHIFLPQSITEDKIIPLLKGKLLDISSSTNYRPITISSSASKIVENILYNRIVENLGCEDNQFGYKNKSDHRQNNLPGPHRQNNPPSCPHRQNSPPSCPHQQNIPPRCPHRKKTEGG